MNRHVKFIKQPKNHNHFQLDHMLSSGFVALPLALLAEILAEIVGTLKVYHQAIKTSFP